MTDKAPGANRPGLRSGYRQPPKDHQFKKGQSGNPKGRPKKNHRSLGAIVAAELRKPVPVTQNGERVMMTRLEAIVTKAVQDALTGSPAERRLALKLLAAHLPQEALHPLPAGFRVHFIKADKHDENL
ncbi:MULTISPECIES: DUF5681 domain-containing protein [Sphingomonas]|uniref:DUF5681 domain-containing protein n=1 Tax=Sphingomonas TaxID=13687 RepID=UPI001269C23F|nr:MULTISPECIES: DUF5681 domain-containing protein [Sphingomonas]